jgi:hypothetical protein
MGNSGPLARGEDLSPFFAPSGTAALFKLLGHASITTTQRYTDHQETAELRATIPMLPSTAA